LKNIHYFLVSVCQSPYYSQQYNKMFAPFHGANVDTSAG
jgi:hypothetical protein